MPIGCKKCDYLLIRLKRPVRTAANILMYEPTSSSGNLFRGNDFGMAEEGMIIKMTELGIT
jgi:hypothetical protein